MPNKVFATGVLLFFIVFVLMGENNFFNNLIGAILGKDPSFSGRQNIWKMALLMIGESPWGIGPEASFNPWSNQTIYVYSAHNTFLDIAVRSGIATAIVFAAMFLTIVFRCTKKSSEGNIVAFFLVLALLASMMESNQGYYILWVLISFGVLEATVGIRPYPRSPNGSSTKRLLPCHGEMAACSVSFANRRTKRRVTR